MKTLALFFAILIVGNATVQGQTPPDLAADLVLGASGFDSAGTASNDASGIDYPLGVDIDPLSGKVFVCCYQQNRVLRFASAGALANGDAAEAVIGQSNFNSNSSGLSIASFDRPHGICLDNQGRLWVADVFNHRVVMFANAASLTDGAGASLVLGQINFTSNETGAGSAQMFNPANVFVDASDNLWVCDYSNHRVLKFAMVSTLSNGAAASVVIGQPGFGVGGSSTAATGLYHPADVHVDSDDHLWIVEQSNNRVLRFDGAASLISGASATAVLGQVNFTSNSQGTTATTMRVPSSVAMQSDGSLWVADQFNNRILIFLNAAAKGNGAAADGVVGQPDLSTGSTGVSDRRLNGPAFGIAFDLEGHLWVPDTQNDRVLRFPTVPLPQADVSAPTLIIRSKVPRVTGKSSIKVSGVAIDESGISSVQFRVGGGAFARAIGTNSWSFKARLKTGKNKIQIFAADGVGNTSPRKSLNVVRK